MAALSGEDPRAPAGSIAVFGNDVSRASAARAAASWAALRARRAAGPRRGAHACRWRRTRCSRAPRTSAAAAGCTWPAEAGAGGIADRALQGQGRRPGCGGAQSLSGGNLQKFIVGREIDANPKLLIVSQPTWGVDVGAAAQIRGEILALRDARLRGAGGQRGAGRAVRDQRPPARDRQGPPVAVERAGREARRSMDDRRVDVRACGSSRRNAPQAGAGGRPCLGSNPGRSRRGSGALPRRCWRWR